MRETTPQVRLLARPSMNWGNVFQFLADDVGDTSWFWRVRPHDNPEEQIASDAELLVEFAGRRCYKSWAPGLNANVTKVREDSGEYLGNILASKHGAVLEHAQFTFDFADVSRVFTHELVRHRAGVAISQESLRYVRLTDIGFRIPDVLTNGPMINTPDGDADTMHDRIVSIVEKLEEFQREAAEAFGLDDEGVPFHYKKEVTSALRRLAPLGLSTGMVWSANIRTLRHLIQLRTAPSAEEEIRLVFNQVARIMHQECPLLFADFQPQHLDTCAKLDHGDRPLLECTCVPAWVPEWEKV